MPQQPAWRAPRGAVILLGVALAAGAALRLAPIPGGFWLDELYTAHASDPAVPLTRLLRERILPDPQPPGYYLLMWGWHHLVGTGEGASRALGGAAGALALPLTARLLAGVVAPAVLASGICALALSWFAVYYAHEARAYALLYALSGVGYALVLRTLVLGLTRRRTLALAGVAIGAGLLHYYGMVLGCALWVARAAGHWQQGRRRAARDDLVVMAALAVFFVLLLVPQTVHLGRYTGGEFWVRNDLVQLAQQYRWLLAPGALGAAGMGLLAALALAGARREQLLVPLAAGLAASVAAPALVSLHTPILVARHLIITAPPLLLGLAAAARPQASPARFALVVLALAALGTGTAGAYLGIRKEDWRSAAALVVATDRAPCPLPVWEYPDGQHAHYLPYLPATVQARVAGVPQHGPVRLPPPGCRLVLWAGHVARLELAPPPGAHVVRLYGHELWVHTR